MPFFIESLFPIKHHPQSWRSTKNLCACRCMTGFLGEQHDTESLFPIEKSPKAARTAQTTCYRIPLSHEHINHPKLHQTKNLCACLCKQHAMESLLPIKTSPKAAHSTKILCVLDPQSPEILIVELSHTHTSRSRTSSNRP